jgi:hypothetical protein
LEKCHDLPLAVSKSGLGMVCIGYIYKLVMIGLDMHLFIGKKQIMSFHLHFPISHQEILLKADIGGL